MIRTPKPATVRLGWIASVEENGKHSIGVTTRELREEDWVEYQTIISVIPEFRPRLIDFLSARHEAENLLAAPARVSDQLRKITHPMMIGGQVSTVALTILQTAFTSYLSARSAMIYRAERYLSRKFGSSASSPFQEFKTAQSREYDGHFAYRLFASMRNFSQHRSIPISNLQIHGKGSDPTSMDFEPKITISRTELLDALTEEAKQPKFRAELADATEDHFNIFEMTEIDFACLNRLFVSLYETHHQELAEAEHYKLAVLRIIGRHVNRVLEDPQAAPISGFVPVIFEGEVDRRAKPHLFSFDELDHLTQTYLEAKQVGSLQHSVRD